MNNQPTWRELVTIGLFMLFFLGFIGLLIFGHWLNGPVDYGMIVIR